MSICDLNTASRFLSETEVSELLRISEKTLRRWRWAGQGPKFFKFGRSVRYNSRDLDAFIERSARTSTSQGSAVR